MAEFEEFAVFQFELAAPEDDGVALIEHLRAAERQTGVTPQMLLDAPRLPQGCDELWRIFNELHSCRGSNGFEAMRITYGDIDAFQRVTGITLKPWELRAVRKADSAYLASPLAKPPKHD